MTENIDDLLENLLKDPEKFLEEGGYDEETQLKLLKKLNPYGISNKKYEEKKKVAYTSFTNLEQDYMERFQMTSMVGFIYKMMKEYQVDRKDRVFIDDSRSRDTNKDDKKPISITDIDSILGKINNFYTQLKESSHALERIEYQFLTYELEDKKPSKEEIEIKESLEKANIVAKFAITQTLVDIGMDASDRIHSVIKECRKHKDVIADINQKGLVLPPPPEEVEIPEDNAKNIIKTFVDSIFEYDADQHVKSAADNGLTHDPDAEYDDKDPERPTMKLLKAASKYPDHADIFSDRTTYNSCMYLLNNKPELLQKIASDPDKYKKELTPIRKATELVEHMPPMDTFHRWNYYKEVNMEEIRSVVSHVYHEKPVFDFAMIIYDTFEGTDEEIEKHRKKFATQYNEELCSDLKVIPVGNWAVLGDYKKNRDTIDFYNRHTEILKRIMDEHESGKKLGKDLMKKRVKKAKAKNIEEAGTDAEILKEYKKQVQDLTAMGAVRALKPEEKEELENAKKNVKDHEDLQDCPDDAVRINVFTHDTESGKLEKSKFYTKSEEPPSQEEIAKTNKEAIEAMS